MNERLQQWQVLSNRPLFDYTPIANPSSAVTCGYLQLALHSFRRRVRVHTAPVRNLRVVPRYTLPLRGSHPV